MTKPILRIRSLRFQRGSLADGPGCIPVRASRHAPVPAVDWFRDDVTLSSAALAFPVGLARQHALLLRAEFDVIEASSGPLLLRAVPRGSHLLGQVFSTPVGKAAQGDTLVMDLALNGHDLAGAAVGQHQLVWIWQHRQDRPTSPWVDFDETAHTVFTLLDHPAPPWGGPADPRTVVPWLETMKTACGWAKGVRDPEVAMDRITTSVSALGGKQIGDDTLDYAGGPSVTWLRTFFISSFMKAVKGEPDAPGAMNCVDLASAVAVFAAQIGCRSRALRLLPKTDDPSDQLRTNKIRLFGERRGSLESFSRHEVAQLDKEKVVWDACVSLDFDAKPGTGPNEFGLPTGMGLDGDRKPGGHGYLARLLQPSDRDCRIKLPAVNGVRYPDAIPPGVLMEPDPVERVRRRLFSEEMRGMPRSMPTAEARGGGFGAWLESVTLEHAFARSSTSGSRIFKFIPIRPQDGDGKAGARVSVLLPSTRHRAVDIFLGLLTSYTHTLRRRRDLGDYCVYGERDDTIYMLRGGLIAVIQGDRATAESALTTARTLDRRLSNYFAAPGSSTT